MYKTYDVLIVGAGTAGSYAAYLMAKQGLSVALVERKRAEEVFKVTGDAIGKHHIEELTKSGLSISNDVFMIKYEGAELYSPDLSIKYFVAGEGYGLDIGKWAQWLINAANNSGADIIDNHTVSTPIIEGGFVKGVKASRRDGTQVELRAKVTVDASGATGVVRTKLPSQYRISEPLLPEDASYAYREIVEVDYSIPNPQNIRIYLDNNISPGGYWWFFPKSDRVANVGLGIWGRLVKENGLNPRINYEKYLASSPYVKGRKLLHTGGGIVPTRRPLASMVGPGIVAVGDAAVAVNPIHGGGIGPALLSSALASKAIIEALEKGDVSEAGLWRYNLDYLNAYGIKQAQLDVFRLMLQTLTNDQLNRGLRARILTEDEVLRMSISGNLDLSGGKKALMALRLLKVPDVARKLSLALRYMNEIKKIYINYPRDPSELNNWLAALVAKYNEYRLKLKLPLMTL
ncbi:digeranylgeranylglycerophospholipid reductase [Caldivirga maquilingensis]|uniref:Geranylgeranyl reductase n=1 Tax=Caldivirga maquilingensis (strain ATCC 700844 / DSM 13496 / JCM 10307 / IC-167) TaxID=397948 RepID=A8MAE2_CALMQ|nr:digeranylgeranylglycerophospholipid reductase [Caldivirga maquilingensis]ABW02519.1 geranylgeranyl reductase [Caldivirga maquilingensis IC-167]